MGMCSIPAVWSTLLALPTDAFCLCGARTARTAAITVCRPGREPGLRRPVQMLSALSHRLLLAALVPMRPYPVVADRVTHASEGMIHVKLAVAPPQTSPLASWLVALLRLSAQQQRCSSARACDVCSVLLSTFECQCQGNKETSQTVHSNAKSSSCKCECEDATAIDSCQCPVSPLVRTGGTLGSRVPALAAASDTGRDYIWVCCFFQVNGGQSLSFFALSKLPALQSGLSISNCFQAPNPYHDILLFGVLSWNGGFASDAGSRNCSPERMCAPDASSSAMLECLRRCQEFKTHRLNSEMV